MDYFSRFLRADSVLQPAKTLDHAQQFSKSWDIVKTTLQHPDERQLTKGVASTDVPKHLKSMVDSLVWESTRTEEGTTGACMEYLLKNDVLGILVKLSESDRPFGIQAEVLRSVQSMVVLLDDQFLVHSAVHRAVLRLLRSCVGDDIQEQLDGHTKVMGAAKNAARSQPSEYEEDLVNLLCILCSRIRTYRELLMIFFHDKHWYRSEPLFSVEEGDEGDEDSDEDYGETTLDASTETASAPSPAPEPAETTSAKKPEYEFLLFNYLLRFVHREGKTGDFARAGLLFLIDVAMSPNLPSHILSSDVVEVPSDPITDAALALAEYILDGDFSEVLGAGLGAVYSLLPSKLEIKPPAPSPETSTGMVLGETGLETEDDIEAERDKSRDLGLEDASSPDFKSRLDHFLKLLEFLQDVMRRNKPSEDAESSTLIGTAIVQSILDSVRWIFLENILYPSVLECSDLDGSAVAVMSYIEVMIRTLEAGQLSDLLVHFLLTEDNDEVGRPRQRAETLLLDADTKSPPQTKGTEQQNKLRRRKSTAMVLLEMEAPDTRRQSRYFTSMGRFTLKDLLLANLKSQSQATATAALQLLHSMLLQHSQISVDRLLLVIPDSTATAFPQPSMVAREPEVRPTPAFHEDDDDEADVFVYPGGKDEDPGEYIASPTGPAFLQPETTFSTHEREMGLYLTLVSRVDPSHNGDAFSTGYEHYLRDALISIQNQSAYQISGDAEARAGLKHRLNANDSLLSLVLESLRRFFANTPEFNIALTGVLATLAIHPDRSLAGWLTFAVNDMNPPSREHSTDDAEDDGDDRSIDFAIEEKLAAETNFLPATSMDEKSKPIVHSVFQGLVAQLERYRQMVDDFDKYLLERRQGLLFSENLTDALTLALDMTDDPRPSTPEVKPVRPKPKSKASSTFASFLTPKKAKPKTAAAPAGSSTPSRTERQAAASPFAPHYQHTGGIKVEPFIAPVPNAGPWTPAKRSAKWKADEEDVFSAGQWGGDNDGHESDDEEEQAPPVRKVTLSHLLDNVVILEESIKELVAIIHARRSLGIDMVRYL